MNDEIEDVKQKLSDIEKLIEKYFDILYIENEIDFILKGNYELDSEIDKILDGTWEE